MWSNLGVGFWQDVLFPQRYMCDTESIILVFSNISPSFHWYRRSYVLALFLLIYMFGFLKLAGIFTLIMTAFVLSNEQE